MTLVPRNESSQEEEDEDEGWQVETPDALVEDARFRFARPGDHLLCPYQCDLCHFRNMMKRDPVGDIPDMELLACVRRAQIDAFWSRVPSTVFGNLIEGRKMLEAAQRLRIENPFERYPRGPFPVMDVFGMAFACTTLVRSLDPGRNSDTVQYDTLRGQRTFVNNYVHTTPSGQGGLTTLVGDRQRLVLTESVTNHYFYSRFMEGQHERLGDVRIPDRALSIDELLALMVELEQAWDLAKENTELRFEIATIGCIVANGFCGGLRGEELPHVLLKATRDATEDAAAHRRFAYVMLILRGKFKGLTGIRLHHVPLAATSNSGIANRRWLYRLLLCYEEAGVKAGPLFRESLEAQESAPVAMLDVLFHQYLKRVQATRPDMLPESVDVEKEFSLRRSLRRGSTTQARNKQVPRETIELNNRWNTIRTFETLSRHCWSTQRNYE